MNRANQKSYIGQTRSSLDDRWNGHVRSALRGEGGVFHKAIRKYGASGFDHAVLETCSSAEEANKAEQRWIAHFRSNQHGYNLDSGGGVPHTRHASTKKRISLARTLWWSTKTPEEKHAVGVRINAGLSKEQRSALVKAAWLKATDKERNAQIVRLNAARTPQQRSESMKRAFAKRTPEQRSEIARQREARKTPEQRSAAARKRVVTLGRAGLSLVAKKISESMAARTAEQKATTSAKISAALRSRTPEEKADSTARALAAFPPEVRAAKANAAWADPEKRRRLSEACFAREARKRLARGWGMTLAERQAARESKRAEKLNNER